MVRFVRTTLYLKKAELFPETQASLEDIILKVADDLPDFVDRKFNVDLLSDYYISSIKRDVKRNAGAFVRISLNDIGSTGIMTTKKGFSEGDVEEHSAPKGKAFVQGEIYLYVAGNHLIACGIGNRDKMVSEIISHIASLAGAINNDTRLFISDVPNAAELNKINKVGVKSIDFDLSTYLADVETMPFEKRITGIGAVLFSMFGKVPEAKDATLRSETRGKILLSRGKFRKTENLVKDEWLTNVGQAVVNADLESYTIVLEDGSKVSTKSIKTSKPVKIKKYANTFQREHAEMIITEYFGELLKNGSLSLS